MNHFPPIDTEKCRLSPRGLISSYFYREGFTAEEMSDLVSQNQELHATIIDLQDKFYVSERRCENLQEENLGLQKTCEDLMNERDKWIVTCEDVYGRRENNGSDLVAQNEKLRKRCEGLESLCKEAKEAVLSFTPLYGQLTDAYTETKRQYDELKQRCESSQGDRLSFFTLQSSHLVARVIKDSSKSVVSSYILIKRVYILTVIGQITKVGKDLSRHLLREKKTDSHIDLRSETWMTVIR